MRVLFVHNDYAAPSGEEHAVEAISGLLRSHGHEILWIRKSSAGLGGSRFQQVRAFLSGIHSRSSSAEMAALLDDRPVDVVYVQNLYPWISPSIFAPCRARNVPVVMRCPNYRVFCPNGLHLCRGQICERCLGGREWWCVLRNCEGSLSKSLGYALRNAAARIRRTILDGVTTFIVLSEFQKARFAACGIPDDRIGVLPNQATAGKPDEASSESTFVSYVGRLSPEKGLGLFVDVARSMPSVPFAVAGDTSGMPELVRRSPPNVKYMGFLGGRELEDFYCRTRVLVVPSLCFEGFPNVIAAAMLRRIPVVCSRLGGLPEIVEDGRTGLLSQPGNADELKSKVGWLLERPTEAAKMGRAGHEKALRCYSPERVYAKLVSILERAVVQRKER